MFRKSAPARRDWNPDLVSSCALRQSAILQSAAQMLKPGGILAYSTCTFNPIENESTISSFLKKNPDFEILEVQPVPGCSPGQPDWVELEIRLSDLSRAVRLWPHHTTGEGHFIALMRRKQMSEKTRSTPEYRRRDGNNSGRLPPSTAVRAFQTFAQDSLTEPTYESIAEAGRLSLAGAYLYKIPGDATVFSGLRVIHPGWWLGTLHSPQHSARQRFEPSHALALGLHLEDARRVMNLEARDPLVLSYLRGLTLPWEGADGWMIVAVDGFPLGWGRGSKGQIKNFYPRGLRWS
jgi:NOL1/NOP2/fmu family ribosome biogenesis protein